jgi:hypothetical protein
MRGFTKVRPLHLAMQPCIQTVAPSRIKTLLRTRHSGSFTTTKNLAFEGHCLRAYAQVQLALLASKDPPSTAYALCGIPAMTRRRRRTYHRGSKPKCCRRPSPLLLVSSAPALPPYTTARLRGILCFNHDESRGFNHDDMLLTCGVAA